MNHLFRLMQNVLRTINQMAMFIYRCQVLTHLLVYSCTYWRTHSYQGPHKHWYWEKFPYQSHYIWQPFLTHHHPGTHSLTHSRTHALTDCVITHLLNHHVGKVFLNVFDMLTKRPDGHVGKNNDNAFEDCLHYCIPVSPLLATYSLILTHSRTHSLIQGPFDSFVVLTFSILELIELMAIPDKFYGSTNWVWRQFQSIVMS